MLEKVYSTVSSQDLTENLSVEIDPSLLKYFDVVYLNGIKIPNTEMKTLHYPLDSLSAKDELNVKVVEVGKAMGSTIDYIIRHAIVTGMSCCRDKTQVINFQEYTGKAFAQSRPKEFDAVVLPTLENYPWDERRGAAMVCVEKGKKLGKIYFSPVNRFSSTRTEAKKGYAFAYELEYGVELMCETNFLVVIENPEYIYKGE